MIVSLTLRIYSYLGELLRFTQALMRHLGNSSVSSALFDSPAGTQPLRDGFFRLQAMRCA